uniref:ShKT domain-containing protein n=1 Tax=Strongyloides venezuelensis TaxID=75913 RepID=A0A0K0EZY2_STRVS
MASTKFFLIATLYFTSMKIAHCGDTIPCTASANCTSSTQKCMDIDGVNKACVNVCTTDADCEGTYGSCAATTTGDVGGTTGFSVCPFVIQQCLTDAECSTADPTLPVCNLYTLTCESYTRTMTTTPGYNIQCFTDSDCSVINRAFLICNQYTYTCEPYRETTTTVAGFTTHKKMFPHFLQFIYNLYIGNN